MYSFNTKIYKIYKLHEMSMLCLNISHTSYAYRQTILILYTLYIYTYEYNYTHVTEYTYICMYIHNFNDYSNCYNHYY